MVRCMAACHSLAVFHTETDGEETDATRKIIGDPLDLIMFEHTQWVSLSKAMYFQRLARKLSLGFQCIQSVTSEESLKKLSHHRLQRHIMCATYVRKSSQHDELRKDFKIFIQGEDFHFAVILFDVEACDICTEETRTFQSAPKSALWRNTWQLHISLRGFRSQYFTQVSFKKGRFIISPLVCFAEAYGRCGRGIRQHSTYDCASCNQHLWSSTKGRFRCTASSLISILFYVEEGGSIKGSIDRSEPSGTILRHAFTWPQLFFP